MSLPTDHHYEPVEHQPNDPPPLRPVQVSFRYHCQLYSEWRRTNQKVRLLVPETRESSSSQHSLLSTKLMKKSASESIV